MSGIEVTATIAARIDVVWNVLTEGERYGEWPSGWTDVRGEFEDGGKVTLVAADGDTKVKIDYGLGEGLGRSMRWSSGLPGMGRRQRDFALTEPDGHSTLLRVSDSSSKSDQETLQRFVDAVRNEAERRTAE